VPSHSNCYLLKLSTVGLVTKPAHGRYTVQHNVVVDCIIMYCLEYYKFMLKDIKLIFMIACAVVEEISGLIIKAENSDSNFSEKFNCSLQIP
jgi:hypothetical protein